jgi:hypothetical protein
MKTKASNDRTTEFLPVYKLRMDTKRICFGFSFQHELPDKFSL